MKQTFKLEGLDCAHCAEKLQAALQRLPGVRAATVDFLRAQLTIEGTPEDMPGIAAAATQTIHKLEPEVVVTKQPAAARPSLSPRLDRWALLRILAGAVLFAVGLLLPPQPLALTLSIYLAALVVAGGDVLFSAVKNILRGQVFDENLLMTLAAIGAFCIGEYPEGVAVMLFYQVGELFQHYAVGKSRASIAGLMNIRPDYANLCQGENTRRVDPATVHVGDVIQVRPGEKVPLDAIVLQGSSQLDTGALTGESLPRSVAAGDALLSGCINLNGLLRARVIREYEESTASKILDLVENATSKKSASENFITRFARVYTPIVVGVAALLAVLPPLVLPGATFAEWLHRALVFLVISCPCALVISVPLSFFGGIGGASRQGILIKGSNYLEALAHAEIAVFDKTGTLTQGSFQVQRVYPTLGSPQALLATAARAECHSSHPIALSLRQAYGQSIDADAITDVREIPGCGVAVTLDGKRVHVGNAQLLRRAHIPLPSSPPVAGTLVHVAIDGTYAGYIHIADAIKPDAATAIRALKQAGIRQTVMLTGDSAYIGQAVAKELGIDRVYAQLLPADKVQKVEQLLEQTTPKGKLVYVGDGINDAPVLARADIGIAMGGLGSDAAIEASDIVIMTDQPSKVATALGVARRTLGIARQNIVFALAVKLAILILGACGIATMWEAVFADVGVSVLAILNAIRALYTRRV